MGGCRDRSGGLSGLGTGEHRDGVQVGGPALTSGLWWSARLLALNGCHFTCPGQYHLVQAAS